MNFFNKKILVKTIKYINRSNISNQEKEKQIKIITEIMNQKTKIDRYSMLFDKICDYLDEKSSNYCGFKDGTCDKRRCIMEKTNIMFPNCCCYSIKQGESCKNITSQGCSIRNISCKLYMCRHIRKKYNIRFSLNNIYLAKYTLNIRQKIYLSNTFFVPKDVVMKGILKRRGLYGI